MTATTWVLAGAGLCAYLLWVIWMCVDKIQSSLDRIEVLLKNLPDKIRHPD